ncbi:N-acetyl-1-D-myo-inositol-2-amino-2-deoxy-alpha-D -glucopyranoside deacetylase [Rhodococcus aerolatus]
MSGPAGDGRARLLLVHAHPDDESITTGGTIARYVAAGAEVTVLTCTLGEQGEVIGPRWAHLVAEEADQLGGFRIGELTTALARLGVAAPRFLGHAGRWRDSGMAGTPAAEHPRSFVRAADDDVTEAVVRVVRELRPHVVVGYDPAGTYGHPDHVRVHAATTAGVAAAADPAAHPGAGPAWAVPKVYWTVVERTALRAGLADLGPLPAAWRAPARDELPSVPDAEVTAVVDVRPVLGAKLAALRAHATQVTVAPGDRCYALSNDVAQPVLAEEHYVLVAGEPGERGADGREHDLLAGLDVPGLAAAGPAATGTGTGGAPADAVPS